MNNEWVSFLQAQQAHIDSLGVSHYAEQPAEADGQSDFMCDLSQLGLLKVSGEDAASFLQGQLSNDVDALDGQHSQLASYCSPKGRILASFRLYRDQDDFYLLMPADTLAATLKRLRMFVLMSKVNIEDISDEFIRIGLCGKKASEALSQLSIALPTQQNGLTTDNDLQLLAIESATPRYILVGKLERIKDTWNALGQHLSAKGYHSWNLMDIQDGIPSIVASTVDAFVPQMVNLHAINGVSFSKGCYPGQEIVARMHFLGKLKRRMYRAQVNADQLPQPGDKLFSATSSSGQGAGQVVTAAAIKDGGYEILAVIQITALEEGSLHLGDINGPELILKDIPYEVPLEREK